MFSLLPKTQWYALTALGTLLCAILLLATVVYFAHARQVEVRTKAEELKKVEIAAQQLVSLTALKEETALDRAMLASFVVTEDTVINLLTFIESLGGSTGIDVSTQTVAKEKIANDSVFESLVITLESSGTRAQLTHFLEILENMPYHVSVRKFDLSAEGERGLMRMSAEIVILKRI